MGKADVVKKVVRKSKKITPPMSGEFRSLYGEHLQRAADAVEEARALIWMDNDPGATSDLLDEAIDALVAIGVERRERDYNNDANPAGLDEPTASPNIVRGRS